jgi:hypothetical protein
MKMNGEVVKRLQKFLTLVFDGDGLGLSSGRFIPRGRRARNKLCLKSYWWQKEKFMPLSKLEPWLSGP